VLPDDQRKSEIMDCAVTIIAETALDAADDQLARAVGKIRERAGDDRDVVWLVETIERRPDAVRKLLSRGRRGGKSARQAAALERRNQALRQLRANKLYATLPPGAAASLICANFQTYAAIRWPREHDAPVAPRDEPQRTFWTILRNHHKADGPKMPGWRQLATILDLQGD
jgi:hypothetical protein